jgi:predicted nucleic acid-binding Zn ribbon protein
MNLQDQLVFFAARIEGEKYKCRKCGAEATTQANADAHALEHTEMEAREFSQKRRKKLAKSGKALPGGGFPIVNKEDLGNARKAIGRAKNPAAARAHIRKRAKALGVKLSKNWQKHSS